MINRLLEDQLRSRWRSGKASVVMGPRQVGKTTLLKKLCDEHGAYQLLNTDEADVRNQLENANLVRLKQLIGANQVLFIDEAD